VGIVQFIVVTVGALAGGFVSGLAGFGTGITAIGIWLYAVPPPVAASLVVVCSVISQAQTIPVIWRSIEAERVFPFIVPGIFGVPLGTVLLSHLDTRILKLGIGSLLLLFSAYCCSEDHWRRAHGAAGSRMARSVLAVVFSAALPVYRDHCRLCGRPSGVGENTKAELCSRRSI
jgi:uncharacterized protein